MNKLRIGMAILAAPIIVACQVAENSEHAAILLRTFDAVCIATRLDESIFHTQMSLFRNTMEVSADDLRMMSPTNIAGYYLTDVEGQTFIAVMGSTQADDILSRNCGVLTRSVGFEEAVALVADNFPVEKLDEFNQGISRYVTFQGYLAGYPGNMAISVQGGEGGTGVYLYELPTGGR